MNELLEEAIKVVREINDEAWEVLESKKLTSSPEPYMSEGYLSLSSNGYDVSIDLCRAISLWNSSDDKRDYCEELDCYEDLEGFIRKRIQVLTNMIVLIGDGISEI